MFTLWSTSVTCADPTGLKKCSSLIVRKGETFFVHSSELFIFDTVTTFTVCARVAVRRDRRIRERASKCANEFFFSQIDRRNVVSAGRAKPICSAYSSCCEFAEFRCLLCHLSPPDIKSSFQTQWNSHVWAPKHIGGCLSAVAAFQSSSAPADNFQMPLALKSFRLLSKARTAWMYLFLEQLRDEDKGPLRNPVSQVSKAKFFATVHLNSFSILRRFKPAVCSLFVGNSIYLFICKNRLLSFIRTSVQGRGKCIKIIYFQQIADGGNVFSSFMEIFR